MSFQELYEIQEKIRPKKQTLYKQWFDLSLEHLKCMCLDENCRWYHAFNQFLRDNNAIDLIDQFDC